MTRAARWIAEETGSRLVSIVARKPYPVNFENCYELASAQRVERIRPALSDETLARLEVLRQAKTVFLVFPNWDYSLPVVVQTLLGSVDWSGKRVLPACLHGTGGLSRTIRELYGAVRGAKGVTVGELLLVYWLEINRSEARVKAWARKSPKG